VTQNSQNNLGGKKARLVDPHTPIPVGLPHSNLDSMLPAEDEWPKIESPEMNTMSMKN
jgi:hypothetical protein